MQWVLPLALLIAIGVEAVVGGRVALSRGTLESKLLTSAKTGNWQTALVLLDQLVDAGHGTSTKAHNNAAMACIRAGRHTQALLLLDTLRERGGWLRLASANFVHVGAVHLWLNCVGLLRAASLLRSIQVSEADLLRITIAAGLATTVFGAAQGSVQGASGIVFGYNGALAVSSRFSWVVLLEPLLICIVTAALFAYGIPIVSYSGHLGGMLAGGVLQVSVERTRGTHDTHWQLGKPRVALLVYCAMLGLAVLPWLLGGAPSPLWLVAPSVVGGGYVVAGVRLSARDANAVDYFPARSFAEVCGILRRWAGEPPSPTAGSASDGVELTAPQPQAPGATADAEAIASAEEERQVQLALAASLATASSREW